jgi:hypothetical protein
MIIQHVVIPFQNQKECEGKPQAVQVVRQNKGKNEVFDLEME